VSKNKILNNEITNGHAARMRYSRFKTQMDSSIGIVKKRRKNSPRKPKVEKVVKKEKVRKDEKSDEVDEQQDAESEREERQKCEDEESMVGGRRLVKRELVETSGEYASGMPYTPKSQYSTPSPGMSHHGFDTLDNDLDDMATSFGFSEAMGADMYAPMMGHGYDSGMGMGMSMGMADSFDPLWHEHEARQIGSRGERELISEDGVLVKNEPRWEEGYRR
jgi:hypothetical protein